MVFLRVFDDWGERDGAWRTFPWATFEVAGKKPWPEEPVWVNLNVPAFIRRWYETADPRKIELWVSGADPTQRACYFTSDTRFLPRRTWVRTTGHDSWWVMRAIW